MKRRIKEGQNRRATREKPPAHCVCAAQGSTAPQPQAKRHAGRAPQGEEKRGDLRHRHDLRGLGVDSRVAQCWQQPKEGNPRAERPRTQQSRVGVDSALVEHDQAQHQGQSPDRERCPPRKGQLRRKTGSNERAEDQERVHCAGKKTADDEDQGRAEPGVGGSLDRALFLNLALAARSDGNKDALGEVCSQHGSQI